MGAKKDLNADRRIRVRKPLELRVDVKILPQREVDDILEGSGYPDLSAASLSMSRPRGGMDGMNTLDVSESGMRLRCADFFQRGMAAALDLHLPGQRTVLKFLGEVMWTDAMDGVPKAGIRIAALDEDSDRRFKGFLQAQS